MPATKLALLLLLIFVATSCAQTPPLNFNHVVKPDPEPALPAGCDPFNPPALGVTPVASAPVLAEWTRTAGPDSVVAMTGSRMLASGNTSAVTAPRFEVFGENAAGSYTGTATIQCLDGMKAAVVLPAKLPLNSEYLLWAVNDAGPGAPAVINATEAWWIGPNAATRGDTVSVYGRNLTQNASAKASNVYIQAPGLAGVWATVTAANPYKVDFTVPSTLTNGTYQVWVHNGHGGHYGWSGPLALTIDDGMPWTSHVYNVKSYGATGDGATDDQAAIEQAVVAAGKDPWSTVYLPAGTYMVSRGFTPPSQVRWMGDGAAKTFLRANSSFVKPASWDGRAYCLLFSQNNNDIQVQDMTVDTNGNLNGYLTVPVFFRFDTDVRFIGVTISAKGYGIADFHGSMRLQLQNCTLIGTDSGVFFGAATQVIVNGCKVYGTNDANTLLTSWGGDSLSFTNTTGQDFDNTTSDGWAQGRFIYGSSEWGSNRNIYIGDCTTTAMGVRPAFGNQNTGEQLLWENATMYSGTPLVATATTVTFGSNPVFTYSGLRSGQYDAVITNGTGLGQHRKIVGCTGTTITVSPAWNVAPDATSTVLIAGVVANCAVYKNTLQGKSTYATQVTASAGIQPYGNSFDFIADSNAISQVRTGIGMWSMAQTNLTPQSIDCVYFNSVVNNTLTHCLDGIAGISEAGSNWPAQDAYPGVSYLANTCAGNMLISTTEAGLAQWADGAPIGDQEDLNVFERNVVSSTPIGLQTESAGHVKNTVLYKNSLGAAVEVTK